MRILFVSHTGAGSRAERALLGLTERLDALEISLLSPAGEFREQALRSGAPCQPLDESAPGRLPGGLAHIRHRVREWKPDIIHALDTKSGVMSLVATMGMRVRIVWQLQDASPESPLTPASRLLFALSTRAHAVCVGGYTKRKSVRMHRIDDAVDPVLFHPATRTDRRVDASSLRNGFGFSAGAFVMAMVSRITESEGLLEVIRIFPAILAQVPKAVLLIAGTPSNKRDWEYRSRIDQSIKDLGLTGRICLTGEREDMAPLYRGIDALIVNSAAEPSIASLLQAMACGRPVVAVNVGGAPKVIRNRHNGLLFEAGNYSELVRHLVGLAASLPVRDEMGARARESVTCQFTTDIQRTQLLAMYHRVLQSLHLSSTDRFDNTRSDITQRARL
jgi:glycosyltransferase involved in cell wall biosynthesis